MSEKHKPLGLFIRGERYAGKDTAAFLLENELQKRGIQAGIRSTAFHLKRQFCLENGLDFDRFLNDRIYKEAHRPGLTQYVKKFTPEESFQKFKESIAADLALFQVLIISDLRSREDFQALSVLMPAFFTIRINASKETRRSRGWIPTSYDQSVFETGLNAIPADFIIDNNSTLEELNLQLIQIIESLPL